MDHLEDLRQQYLTNYYYQKLADVKNKEEVFEKAKEIIDNIITEIKEEQK